jgi:beta-glucosidase
VCNGTAVAVGAFPGCQGNLLQTLKATYPGTPLIVVVITGNPMALTWEAANANAIIDAFYPGSLGGQAVAEVIFGAYNPGGRLPFTVVSNITAQPSLADVDFVTAPGRTYRYYTGTYLWPFGFGLSFTKFAYSQPALSAASIAACEPLTVNVTLTNAGAVDGDEVVQVYVGYPASPGFVLPRWSLRQFTRVLLPAGYSTVVSLTLSPDAFTVVDDNGARQVLPGAYTIYVGGQQPGQAAPGGNSCGQTPLQLAFSVVGPEPLPYADCPGGGF